MSTSTTEILEDSPIDGVMVVVPQQPHDDYGPQINLTLWCLSAVAAIWLAVRVYCKSARHRGLWWDDYVLLASWFVLQLGNIAVTLATRWGFGKHNFDVNPTDWPMMLLSLSFAGSFMIIGAAWSKTSFAISLLRISTGWTRTLIWFIIVSVNVVLGLSVLFTWIRCWPLEKMWISALPGSCWNRWITLYYNMFTSAYSGAMDIVLALLPWKMLWQLPMNKKEKVGALAAMSMGVFAGITSLIKMQTIPGSGSGDIVDSVQLIILGAAEIIVTIIAASIPILRALARDRDVRSHQHLILDATPTLSWTRRWSSRTRNSSGSLNAPEMAQSDANTGPKDENEAEQNTPAPKRVWYKSRRQLKHLSQIAEADEASRNRDSGIEISPV